MRFASDTGGTFTDLVVESDDGQLTIYKAPTTPEDPVNGTMDALELAANDHGLPLSSFLQQGSMFIHATTHAINAILTGHTARTALLTTQGHPDILTLREGGRPDPFDFTIPFPRPYVPRALTFEIPERIGADGSVRRVLDEKAVAAICRELTTARVEAVAVCLLWSPLNPAHELRIGEILQRHLPSVSLTLSHQVNPALREFRRATATCIDASLKPLVGRYLGTLTERLRSAGFGGRVLVVTSQGGMVDAAAVAKNPIQIVNSGPSMAPIAGRAFAAMENMNDDVIVADTGGTTFDVSVVRSGRVPLTRELWIGPPVLGHPTGLPSVDVRSVGAGGGSIARVDTGGVLYVGPQSAGAWPGPACYGRGGINATVTDAALVLGFLDPATFLGGDMKLDTAAAERAVQAIGGALGVAPTDAAAAIMELATETMAQAIIDITVNQGMDPAQAILVGGGGAAGFNIVFIARRLGCRRVVIPEVGATLSAAGALISDLVADRRATLLMTTDSFEPAVADGLLKRLEAECREFAAGPGRDAVDVRYSYSVEARYAEQAWEIEVALPFERFGNNGSAVEQFRAAFDTEHRRLYAFSDEASTVEIVGWRAGVTCKLREGAPGRLPNRTMGQPSTTGRRRVVVPGVGHCEAMLHRLEAMPECYSFDGPAVVESDFTTIVIDRGRFRRAPSGSLVIDLS